MRRTPVLWNTISENVILTYDAKVASEFGRRTQICGEFWRLLETDGHRSSVAAVEDQSMFVGRREVLKE